MPNPIIENLVTTRTNPGRLRIAWASQQGVWTTTWAAGRGLFKGKNMNDRISPGWYSFAFVMLLVLIAGGMWGCPRYSVYQQELEGEAALKRAQQTKQILVQQAQAELDAAEIRNKAIRVMGQAARDYPEYRQQEFIAAFAEAIHEGDVRMIFVPTEANIPIMPGMDFLHETEKK